MILKRGSKGADAVLYLQKKLNRAIIGKIKEDGIFGKETEKAVLKLQEQAGIIQDGIVGVRTWQALDYATGSRIFTRRYLSKYLTEKDLIDASGVLGCEPAITKAIAHVESAGIGFIDDKCKILFEGRKFWDRLKVNGFKPREHLGSNEDILHRTWAKKHYRGGLAEYERLNKAKGIDYNSAVEACSWGRFQIMGFHWKALGYKSAIEWESLMQESEKYHLEAFVRFLKKAKLLTAIRNKRWREIENKYNGGGLRGKYARLMRNAYFSNGKGQKEGQRKIRKTQKNKNDQ